MTYIETPADHAFTAFLSGLTPGRVMRDLDPIKTRVERKRARFLRDKNAVELMVARQRDFDLTPLAPADRWAATHEQKRETA